MVNLFSAFTVSGNSVHFAATNSTVAAFDNHEARKYYYNSEQIEEANQNLALQQTAELGKQFAKNLSTTGSPTTAIYNVKGMEEAAAKAGGVNTSV